MSSPVVGPAPSDVPQFDLQSSARSAIVNRTHRVIRERASAMQARRRRVRDLILPLLICSSLLWLVCHAVWSMIGDTINGLEEEAGKIVNPAGLDTSNTFFVLLLWFLPVSILTLATLLIRRSRAIRDDEVLR